ncbi:MAG: argininosuccinate lyase [Chloroflexi bacterium]|nr:MAG: argininosuccinate lyase [Chloroflexota bacterium]MBL1193969.1 argininosuccinate lyase [Chloroflexota bacterium]NOH11264.1 argininosuccinate lyase [Chloroflexota bacterium]
MTKKLWGGRFSQDSDAQAWALNASIDFDQRLALQDIRGSLAWASALQHAGILTDAETQEIKAGLESIAEEFQEDRFAFEPMDEDIHSAVERRLTELIGPDAGKLHTGRSRNDQVVTDFRLWLMEHIPQLDIALAGLQSALLSRAETDIDVIMAGYTHLQRAQPILLSHWWLSHFWPLQRDRERLAELTSRTAVLPLGSGALAGVPFPIDRHEVATDLGFLSVSSNSIDAVSGRDFVAEFLFCTAMIGIHLSKLAEVIILFTTAEFNYFELTDAFTTGSSLMPQKKNPDAFELTRGKTGVLIGNLVSVMTMLKALPSTYDKDLQEDKVLVFHSFDTLTQTLPVLASAISSIQVNAETMLAAIDDNMLATDLADYLVDKGVPFREAHTVVGQAVRQALDAEITLSELPLETYVQISPAFSNDLYAVFDAGNSVARRASIGGTAPQAVAQQISQAHNALEAMQSNTLLEV